jgi:hypothetical protein
VTAADSLGVAVAWPYRRPSLRTEGSVPGLSGTSDLRFRVFESVRIRFRHEGERTANAVGVYAPPGFKSRSLRQLTGNFHQGFSILGAPG